MSEYIKLLILAYFKQYKKEYSFSDIASRIGLSEIQVSEYISDLINDICIEYKDDLLQLTLTGRNRLADSYLENYEFDANIESLFTEEKWEINKVYVPHEFSKKRWRGSK